jgi:hypothetical protein
LSKESAVVCYVTGIAPTEEVAVLEEMLGNVPGVDHSKLTIITKVGATGEHDESFLNFIHCGAPEIESDTLGHIGGDTIMTDVSGTAVPGLSHRTDAFSYFGHPHVVQHVGNLPIPEDEAENYNDAIDDGRVVVAYVCAETETGTYEAAFHSAGVLHVKSFRG